MTDHAIDKREQEVQNVIGTFQPAGCRRLPHARQIRVKAPTIR